MSSSNITEAISGQADKSTTYTKSDVDNLLTRKASSSDKTSALARKLINQQHVPKAM